MGAGNVSWYNEQRLEIEGVVSALDGFTAR